MPAKYYTDRNTGQLRKFINDKGGYVAYSEAYPGNTDLEKTINMNNTEGFEFRRHDITIQNGTILTCISTYDDGCEIGDLAIFNDKGEQIHQIEIMSDPIEAEYLTDELNDLGYAV